MPTGSRSTCGAAARRTVRLTTPAAGCPTAAARPAPARPARPPTETPAANPTVLTTEPAAGPDGCGGTCGCAGGGTCKAGLCPGKTCTPTCGCGQICNNGQCLGIICSPERRRLRLRMLQPRRQLRCRAMHTRHQFRIGRAVAAGGPPAGGFGDASRLSGCVPSFPKLVPGYRLIDKYIALSMPLRPWTCLLEKPPREPTLLGLSAPCGRSGGGPRPSSRKSWGCPKIASARSNAATVRSRPSSSC